MLIFEQTQQLTSCKMEMIPTIDCLYTHLGQEDDRTNHYLTITQNI